MFGVPDKSTFIQACHTSSFSKFGLTELEMYVLSVQFELFQHFRREVIKFEESDKNWVQRRTLQVETARKARKCSRINMF